MPPRLQTHLLASAADLRAVLVEDGADGPRLPERTLIPAPGETAIVAVSRLLRADFEVSWPVLETHLREDRAADGEVVIDALVVCEPAPAGWAPPAGVRWQPSAEVAPAAPVSLRPRLDTWLGELRTGADPPALRPRWSRPGWHARATAWMSAQLERAGTPPVGPIEVRRLWGLSALLYAPTRSGGAWFKAVFPPFAHEPAVTQLLESAAPGTVPRVLAIEPDEGWLLLEHVARAEQPSTDEDALERSIRLLVKAQRSLMGREPELVGLGCPRRPLSSLAAEVARVTGMSPPLPGVNLPAEGLALLVGWVRERAAWLAGVGLPDVVIHGDFHTGNLIVTDTGPVIIDWSDTAIAHPLLDLAALWEAVPDPAQRAGHWSAWLDALAPLGDVESLRGELATIEALGAAYQVVTYADIVRNLEPANHYQCSDGVEHFLDLLASYVPG